MAHAHEDLTRITLGVLFIAVLLAASAWVMKPFLLSFVWALTLVVATWPVMLHVQHYTGNRRGVAVLVMTLLLLLLVLVPMWLALSTIVDHMDQIETMVRTVLSLRVPEPPDWVAQVPVVGASASEAWSEVTSLGVEELAPKLMPYAGVLTHWFAAAVGSMGATFLHFLLTVAIAAVMYVRGEAGAAMARRFGRRLGGERGETAIVLAGQAIRAVALGVVVTALVQSLAGGLLLAAVGVPLAAVLTALMFVLCLAQLGPGLVLFPAVAWMYYAGHSVPATVLVILTVPVVLIENFLRPVLIRRGAHLPLLLILAGVIGGLIAWGLLGIFLGPTVLAVAYTLVNAWMDEGEAPDAVPLTPPRPAAEPSVALSTSATTSARV
ncbi:MAG TPA: AI-2E family transporter YdiK [Acidisphaera sp.]|nr:AI-2E family transporter YdiK [Acidisphaera sp.]